MTDPYRDIPPELADRVARELAADENLVWVGQPRLDLAVRPAYLLVPIGVLFAVFAVGWIFLTVLITFGIMAPCGLPFLAVGVALILSPLWLRSFAKKTVYALSDRRTIILQPTWFGRILVQSFTAAGLGQMSRRERPDGSGDLVFQVLHAAGGESHQTLRRGFLGIDRVKEIEDLVRATLHADR